MRSEGSETFIFSPARHLLTPDPHLTALDLTDQINDDGDLQSRGALQVPGAVTQTVPVVRGVGPLPVRVAVSGGIDCTQQY